MTITRFLHRTRGDPDLMEKDYAYILRDINLRIIPVGLADKSALFKLFIKYGEDDPWARIVENYRESSFIDQNRMSFLKLD